MDHFSSAWKVKSKKKEVHIHTLFWYSNRDTIKLFGKPNLAFAPLHFVYIDIYDPVNQLKTLDKSPYFLTFIHAHVMIMFIDFSYVQSIEFL